MLQNVLFNLSALVALLPATLLAYVRDGFRQGRGPDMVFWAVLAVAAAYQVQQGKPRAHAAIQTEWHHHRGYRVDCHNPRR
mgnify:CR=1 FL=1